MASVKLAYGFFTRVIEIERTSTRDLIDNLQQFVKNNFNVEPDAEIEIVAQSSNHHCELNPKVSSGTVLQWSNDMVFYARIIRKRNNIKYIKTDKSNGEICYIKLHDLELCRLGLLNQAQYFSETQFSETSRPTEPEICTICSENQVHPVTNFNCTHLFCTACLLEWSNSSQTYRCPLCRS